MVLLRHAVVITSMEEDFRKIGLIKEGRHTDGDLREDAGDVEPTEDDEDVEPVEGDADESSDENVEEDVDAIAEAIAFREAAQEMWDGCTETIGLDDEEMEELESMASESVTLPGDVLGEGIDEGDEEDEIAEDDEEEGDEGGEDEGSPFQAVAQAMNTIESIISEDAAAPTSIEEATPAFANMALVSERLFGFYTETAEVQDDEEYAEIAESFKAIAQYSAAIVDTLKTEDPDTINVDALTEVFNEYLGTVLQGLETYAILREADEAESEEEADEADEADEGADGAEDDEDEGEDDEQSEDDRGND